VIDAMVNSGDEVREVGDSADHNTIDAIVSRPECVPMNYEKYGACRRKAKRDPLNENLKCGWVAEEIEDAKV
jgi:hypothetical protein